MPERAAFEGCPGLRLPEAMKPRYEDVFEVAALIRLSLHYDAKSGLSPSGDFCLQTCLVCSFCVLHSPGTIPGIEISEHRYKSSNFYGM